MAPVVFSLGTLSAFFVCFTLAVAYVASLYVWKTKLHRDHPDTVKKRFFSVLVVCTFAPFILKLFSSRPTADQGNALMEWLGMRSRGLYLAVVVPLILTMVLFAGPLYLHYLDGVLKLHFEARYWISNLQNVIWIRNHIVAPFTEEFIFRACMLPVLVPCLGASNAMYVCPLFFGVAHFHHMIEKLKMGADVQKALMQSMFQFGYTTVFGAYSAFLFLRTGHILAPCVAHAFCNHMGFPDFQLIFAYGTDKSVKIGAVFVLGLIAWWLLLYPLTYPLIYGNAVYYV